MALTEIEYGSLASSEVINNNFQYLDNRISTLSEASAGNFAGVNSNIASINSTITNMSEEINQNIEDINTNIETHSKIFSESGLYITTYINENSWYKEYFSDEEKNTRVWLEQGGIANSNSSTVYLKEFQDTNYTLVLGTHGLYFEGGGISVKTQTKFSHANNKGWSYSVEWFACGK